MTTRTNPHFMFLSLAACLLGCLLLMSGCETSDVNSVDGEAPDAQMAASLSQSAKTVATVEENLAQLDLFQSPMSSMADDAGLYQETDFDGWTGDGMSFPEKSARIATVVQSLRLSNERSVATATKQSPSVLKIAARAMDAGLAKAPGDTIAVEYFDGPDSTGLNAAIELDEINMVRFVTLREYPPVLGHVVRRYEEIIIDTQGTLEDDSDDQYHSFECEEEMFGGQVTTCSLAPVSGSGPISDGVLVLARQRVTDPRFNFLQAWTETDIEMDMGDFRIEGDEQIHTIAATVHWRSDAEHRAVLSVPGGGAIGGDTLVLARGEFDAAPANRWIESISDTLLVQLGDMDDEADDLLVEVSRGSVFDGTAGDGGQPRHYVHFLPDTPVAPGEEPCGGEAQQDIRYPENWPLAHLQREADIECDGSGTLHELMEMRDGTSFERTITWDGTGNATVDEERLDGTVISGSFNETTGEYAIETTFPAGHNPISREQHGQAQDNSIEAWDVFVWQDAHADTTYFTAEEVGAACTVSGYKVRGEVREDFTWNDDGEGNISGSWTRNDGASGDFELEALEGGCSHLLFSAEDPAADGSPSVDGELWLAPDGSGTGTVTITQFGTTATFEITFGPDGSGSLEDGLGNCIPL